MPNAVSLFSGVGGLDLGADRAGFNIVAQCESDPYRRRVLKRHWPGVPCFEDVRDVAVGQRPRGGGKRDSSAKGRGGIRGSVDHVREATEAGIHGARGALDGDDGWGRCGGGVPDGGCEKPGYDGGVREQSRGNDHRTVDLLFGGSPCQGLSIAGKRRLLADDRSNLFYEFARLADELVRPGGWLLFENVLGLLSGCSCEGCRKCGELLRLHSRGWGLVGRNARRDSGEPRGQLGLADNGSGDCELEGDTRDSHNSRSGSGRCPCSRCDCARSLLAAHNGTEFSVVRSILGNIGFHDLAWRVLDSRYFGVPQRRRRVFIVARRARGRRAVEVLLEPEGGGGDFEASSKEGKRTSLLAESGAVQSLDKRGGGADDNEAQAGHLSASPDIAAPLTKGRATGEGVSYPGRRQEDDQNLVAHTLRAEGFDASEDGTGRGTPLIAGAITRRYGKGTDSDATDALICPQALPDGVRAASGLSAGVDLGATCAVDPLPDGPRYAACGDAVTVNVAEWLFRRILERGGIA